MLRNQGSEVSFQIQTRKTPLLTYTSVRISYDIYNTTVFVINKDNDSLATLFLVMGTTQYW